MTREPQGLLDRRPPQDIESEKAIIGCILLYPPNADLASAKLSAADFFDQLHGEVFDALVALHEMDQPIDDMTLLLGKLKKYGVVASGFGYPEIAKCIEAAQNAHHIEYYIESVRKESQHRSMFQAVMAAFNKLSAEKPDVDAVGQWLVGKVSEIESRSTIDIVTMQEAAIKAKNRIQESVNKGIGEGVATGLNCIDQTMGGLCPSEVTILAARPGIGKTALGMQIAVNVAQSGLGVLFVSLEMKDEELASRKLCAVSGINSKSIRNGSIRQHQVDDLDRFIACMDYPVMLYAPSKASLRHIAAAVRVAMTRKPLGLVVIDYIQKIQPSNPRQTRQEQIADFSDGIKVRIAREFNVPVLTLCQLNREGEGRAPRMSDLKGAGEIEQDADAIIAIHSSEDENSRELHILKNRHGDSGMVKVRWRPEATLFEDYLLAEMD